MGIIHSRASKQEARQHAKLIKDQRRIIKKQQGREQWSAVGRLLRRLFPPAGA